MQTHKNPNLRAQGTAAPSKSLSGPKPYKAPTATSKVTAPAAKKEAPKKTPKTELEGKKWIVVSASLRGEIKSLFDSCVNAMEHQPFWRSRVEAMYCTTEFCMIIWRDPCKL